MNRLLSAGFVRLKKEKFLWIAVIFMALFGILMSYNAYQYKQEYGLEPSLGRSLFAYGQFVGILASVFSGLFLGTEYSDGTMRNKLIAGHRRITVYLSGLILNVTAALLMVLSFQLALFAAGALLLGLEPFSVDTGFLLFHLAGGFLLTVAYCAIFTFISMLVQKRAVASVTAILVSFILLFAGAIVLSRLSEPEYYSSYNITMDSGDVVETEREPNPHYLRGTERKVYEFLLDFLPGAQSLRLSEGGLDHWQPLAYSLLLAVFFTGGGVLLFKRKNLN
ncbi:MAG: ABC transporter permease subunit [Lachnospiraceae bacterium]|nr:ABC transporter permease subunit [Lachnospiraceae bacterium]